jgi:chromosome segregation ATPase
MSQNDWPEWSKFVILSIKNIQRTLESLEENINSIKTDVRLLQKVDEHTEVDIIKLKSTVDRIENDYKNLERTLTVQKVKMGGILTLASLLGGLAIQVGLKWLFK